MERKYTHYEDKSDYEKKERFGQDYEKCQSVIKNAEQLIEEDLLLRQKTKLLDARIGQLLEEVMRLQDRRRLMVERELLLRETAEDLLNNSCCDYGNRDTARCVRLYNEIELLRDGVLALRRSSTDLVSLATLDWERSDNLALKLDRKEQQYRACVKGYCGDKEWK
ncbi:hypothetical protein A374_17989 [Fictibacillus macauensis ZFHKF-1]|uniref:Uncharacterized protein n=1 Tax=Fictibacillus macauensis ZFHKF-1 TaxID=1196324 RepID=I8IWW5_9BACL|nr:hypothetical protein [Fictibacillus macauensis]EIT83951.1 hypothetical protein A374_17989 [Fictibacillus macauensis ZFHKF-1]